LKANGKTYANFIPEKGKRGPATECADVPDNTTVFGVPAQKVAK
jgi:hypothetical protein